MKRTPYAHIFVLIAFLINILGPIPIVRAQEFSLPAPGVMVHLSPKFNPPILKGIKIHPDNPFRFDFILDKGDDSPVIASAAKQSQQEQLKTESTKLIKYFLASLTIPEKDLWVNLSPYEKNRIIPQSFGLTEMGRDLLAEDYMLKQITASLIYPEGETGRKFWKRVYEEAAKKFGTTNIPVNTFNKVWIVPEKAVVYENAKAGTAYVVEAKLKVMLEQDYLALSKNTSKGPASPSSLLGSQIVREIVIPELTKEVNENKNFSQLRQVYNSLILATWYKKKIKDSILEQVYANKNKIQGLVIPAKAGIHVEAIYQRYLQAFKKGVYNYIKEEQDPVTQQVIPRKYFSGGTIFSENVLNRAMTVDENLPNAIVQSGLFDESVNLISSDRAIVNPLDNVGLFTKELKETVSIDENIDPRLQNLSIIKGDILKSFIDVMNMKKNPLIENRRSDFTYNLLLYAVLKKRREVYMGWIAEARKGMDEAAKRNIEENKKYAVPLTTLRLPRKPIHLGNGFELKLSIEHLEKKGLFVACRIIEQTPPQKEAGLIGLKWDQNTSSWEPFASVFDGVGLKVNDPYRGQGLIQKALSYLINDFGVIRSSGITPDGMSPSAQKVFERMEAGMSYLGAGFEESTGWYFVIRSKIEVKRGDKAQLASGQRQNKNPGGIDLTSANMNFQTQNSGGEIKLHLDPTMLIQLQNAPGFVPVIISIQPLTDLRQFLGINGSVAQ